MFIEFKRLIAVIIVINPSLEKLGIEYQIDIMMNASLIDEMNRADIKFLTRNSFLTEPLDTSFLEPSKRKIISEMCKINTVSKTKVLTNYQIGGFIIEVQELW